MALATLPAWSELVVYGAAEANFVNGLACLAAGCPSGVLVAVGGEPVFLSRGKVLQQYSLHLHFTSLQGNLDIGLEAAALYPQFALELLQPVADPSGLVELLEWLTCEWVDQLEGLLGLQLNLSNVEVCQRREPGSHGVLVSSQDGRHAHLAVSGALIEHLQWPVAYRPLSRVPLLLELAVTVQAIIRIAEVSTVEMEKITCGMLLVLHTSQPTWVVIAAGKKQLRVRSAFINGDASMSSPYENYVDDEHAVSSVHEGQSTTLEQLSMNIDVVLDTLSMSMAELAVLSKGQLMTLGQPSTGRQVHLRCQGRRLAIGEIVAIEDKLAVLIISTDLQPPSQSA